MADARKSELEETMARVVHDEAVQAKLQAELANLRQYLAAHPGATPTRVTKAALKETALLSRAEAAEAALAEAVREKAELEQAAEVALSTAMQAAAEAQVVVQLARRLRQERAPLLARQPLATEGVPVPSREAHGKAS